MTDKEIYKELWEAYTDADALDHLKEYINTSIQHLKRNESFVHRYYQLSFNCAQLEILLKGLNEL